MALINRFTDPTEEQVFVKSERRLRWKTTRGMLVVGLVMFVGFFMVTPVFANNETFIAFNSVMLAVIVAFSLAWYLIGNDLYANRPIVDLSPFLVTMVLAGIVISVIYKSDQMTPLETTVMLVGYFTGNIFIASISFVANFKYFLVTMAFMTAAFEIGLVMIGTPVHINLFALLFSGLFLLPGLYANWEFDRRSREIYMGKLLLEAERKKTETLLYNVLPQTVAERLRAGEVVADSYSDISIIFIDIVGFSKLAKQLSPGHLVDQLNGFFSIADECADRYGIEKVKTIGDCYLAVSGGTASSGHGAKNAVSFARDVII